MKKNVISIMSALAQLLVIPLNAAEKEPTNQPIVITKVLEKAKKNNNWKTAVVTGKQEQIVFMNVSLQTNPKNEIGMENHPFDQVIFIVEGRGQAVLASQISTVKEGDMIFIPQGTSHNIINLDAKKGLKLISFYSETDIPSGAVYEKKADVPNEDEEPSIF